MWLALTLRAKTYNEVFIKKKKKKIYNEAPLTKPITTEIMARGLQALNSQYALPYTSGGSMEWPKGECSMLHAYIGSHMHVAAFKALPIWNLFFKQAVLIYLTCKLVNCKIFYFNHVIILCFTKASWNLEHANE